ncbi:NlpC/P60 family protein [Ancylobacter lacus]|uniref:NlpC/P60 family protein n=1 Tax=Ancylobacter lacus TaxID=2579970 RepID=UPI001BCBFE43|nr:peptidoglycan-binding protein [Ancylobacter lacus]MBS7539751.1 peptidoglycan-binding protein [Ancylobacter lacus]
MDIRDIQRRLIALGYDLGPAGADGVLGRRTTAAVAQFQAAAGLVVKWPGTISAVTQAALIARTRDVAVAPDARLVLPWMAEASRRMGLHEREDNATLKAWLRSDGRTVGDPARLPWCGDFVETCIALGLPHEPLPANPYLARNWLTFGLSVSPTPGAVMVFWRGSRAGTDGHVAFYLGENASQYRIRGGNQADEVSDTWIAKDRLLGARWPTTFDLPSIGANVISGSGASSTNEA